MEQTHPNMRLILGVIFALAVVIATAYLQILLNFNTYVALAICIVAACIFFWIVNGSD
jgi:hypothetical protein